MSKVVQTEAVRKTKGQLGLPKLPPCRLWVPQVRNGEVGPTPGFRDSSRTEFESYLNSPPSPPASFQPVAGTAQRKSSYFKARPTGASLADMATVPHLPPAILAFSAKPARFCPTFHPHGRLGVLQLAGWIAKRFDAGGRDASRSVRQKRQVPHGGGDGQRGFPWRARSFGRPASAATEPAFLLACGLRGEDAGTSGSGPCWRTWRGLFAPCGPCRNTRPSISAVCSDRGRGTRMEP